MIALQENAHELDEDWKRARHQPKYLSKGISISIIKNIIQIINKFTKELLGKILHPTVKEPVDLRFSVVPKGNG
jgi:hypothetical protein